VSFAFPVNLVVVSLCNVFESSFYSIVRHPQFVTFILVGNCWYAPFPALDIIILGIPILPLTYIDLIRADKDAIEKFGDDCKAYMKKVPRANLLLGIIRLLQRRKRERKVDE